MGEKPSSFLFKAMAGHWDTLGPLKGEQSTPSYPANDLILVLLKFFFLKNMLYSLSGSGFRWFGELLGDFGRPYLLLTGPYFGDCF